jgi:hypothetical protein
MSVCNPAVADAAPDGYNLSKDNSFIGYRERLYIQTTEGASCTFLAECAVKLSGFRMCLDAIL